MSYFLINAAVVETIKAALGWYFSHNAINEKTGQHYTQTTAQLSSGSLEPLAKWLPAVVAAKTKQDGMSWQMLLTVSRDAGLLELVSDKPMTRKTREGREFTRNEQVVRIPRAGIKIAQDVLDQI